MTQVKPMTRTEIVRTAVKLVRELRDAGEPISPDNWADLMTEALSVEIALHVHSVVPGTIHRQDVARYINDARRVRQSIRDEIRKQIA